jgi:uncharacterized membrane protein
MKSQPAPIRITIRRGALCVAASALVSLLGPVQAATPAEVMAGYARQAGAAASPERGQALFTRKFKGNLFESCTDCHTASPTARGKDQATDKAIGPMAPAANPQRFTDAGRVENFFRLNCKDVVGRECTAQEKADVMSWLISVKP